MGGLSASFSVLLVNEYSRVYLGTSPKIAFSSDSSMARYGRKHAGIMEYDCSRGNLARMIFRINSWKYLLTSIQGLRSIVCCNWTICSTSSNGRFIAVYTTRRVWKMWEFINMYYNVIISFFAFVGNNNISSLKIGGKKCIFFPTIIVYMSVKTASMGVIV